MNSITINDAMMLIAVSILFVFFVSILVHVKRAKKQANLNGKEKR